MGCICEKSIKEKGNKKIIKNELIEIRKNEKNNQKKKKKKKIRKKKQKIKMELKFVKKIKEK